MISTAGLAAGGILHRPQSASAGDAITPSPAAGRLVGIDYAMWHLSTDWTHNIPATRPWGAPSRGFYKSDDPTIIRAHAEQLAGAGVDFIFIDWSNDLDTDPRTNTGNASQIFIERATTTLCDTYLQSARHPRVSVMLGDADIFHEAAPGRLQRKADQLFQQITGVPAYQPLVQRYLGKPLLIVFIGERVEPRLPGWTDPRFTVRYMSSFISSRAPAFHDGPVSSAGYWSWEDFGKPTFTVHDGHPEAMTVVAAYRGTGSPGRANGKTYLDGWAEARKRGPHIVLAGTFNEWWRAEQDSPNHSKDVEPSVEHGSLYLDILREQAALFKQGR